jgi:hypothetical protein
MAWHWTKSESAEGLMFERENAGIVLGFLISSILWAAILGWQAAYAPTEMEKQACNQKARGADYKTEACESFWERTTRDPVAFFTFTLTVVTLALGAISVRQFHYLRRSDETARIAATAAKAAADAAVASERARFYAVIDHNFVACIDAAAAWDGPFDQEERPLPVGTIPMAKIRFKNYGKTPGILYEVGCGIEYWERVPQPPVYDVKAMTENMIAAGEVSKNFGQVISGQMTMRRAKKVRSGEGTIWIFGYAIYDDVFGKTQTHRFLQRLICVSQFQYILQPYDYKHYNQST